MTRRFIVRARAERDIQATFEWYESQQHGLGDEVLSALHERLETVRNFPESAPVRRLPWAPSKMAIEQRRPRPGLTDHRSRHPVPRQALLRGACPP